MWYMYVFIIYIQYLLGAYVLELGFLVLVEDILGYT